VRDVEQTEETVREMESIFSMATPEMATPEMNTGFGALPSEGATPNNPPNRPPNRLRN
jgi:hypothetical protein